MAEPHGGITVLAGPDASQRSPTFHSPVKRGRGGRHCVPLPIRKHKGGPLPARTYGHDNVLGGVTGPVGFWWEYVGDLVTGKSEKSGSRSAGGAESPRVRPGSVPAHDELCGFKKVTKLAQASLAASIE